jgi:DNA-binding transcriptional regulator YhcF (GntR family)
VDPGAALPVFEQLRSQIERLIVSGQMPEGARLPAIRHLATDLGIAPGTVARVYDELARAGLVVSARRRGTVVAPGPWSKSPDAAKPDTAKPDPAILQSFAEALVLAARQAGLSPADVTHSITQAWHHLAPS